MGTDDLNPASCAAFLVAAFTLAGFCQAAWLGSAFSRRFAVPLDAGRTFRGRRLLGDNKTARGFMAGELPNSFVKRQLGIAPGTSPTGRVPSAIWFAIDRLDSVLGMLVVFSLAVPVPWQTWLYALIAGPALHGAFSMLVFHLGGKARAA